MIIQHEPVPTRHIENYSPDDRADLEGATRALVASLGRIKALSGNKFDELVRTGEIPVIVLDNLDDEVQSETVSDAEDELSGLADTQHIKEVAIGVKELVARAGEAGVSIEEFRQLAVDDGITLDDEATLQALLFGLNEGLFSVTSDNRVVATLETQAA